MPKCADCKLDTEIDNSLRGFVHVETGKPECPEWAKKDNPNQSLPMPKYIILGDEWVHEILSNGKPLKIARLADMVDVWRLHMQ